MTHCQRFLPGDASDAVSDAVSNHGSDYASDMEAELIGEGNEAEGAEEMEDIDDVAQPSYSQHSTAMDWI